MWRILILPFFLLVLGGSVYAQNEQFQFSHLDIRDGLSHDQVTCILKDSQGFMWFGTLSGLNKFDGNKIRIFKQTVGDSTSLNDDCIVSLMEGPDHQIWVQTRNGFNIYDPATERFSHNIRTFLQGIGVPNDSITVIRKDYAGNFWFVHAHRGIYKYDPLVHHTVHLSRRKQPGQGLFSDSVADLNFDTAGNVWLVYNEGVIEKMDPLTYRITYTYNKIAPVPAGELLNYKLLVDNQNDIWVFVPAYSSGVYYLNPRNGSSRHINKGAGPGSLNTDVISDVIQDEKNRIWIATDHGGINLVEKKNFTIRYLLKREDDDKSLAQNSIISLYKDNLGIVWVGTYKKGISFYHESIIKFPLYTHLLSDPQSLPFSDVNKFVEDKSGNLWLGTNGGGLIYFDRARGRYTSFVHNPADAGSLTNNVIVSMAMDHTGKLWIGTYFGGLDCFDGQRFIHYRHSDSDPGSISEDRIWSIIEDSAHNIWVGTLAGGLNLLNQQTGRFRHFKFQYGAGNSIHSNYISALLEDRNKNLWIVTSYGVDVLNRQNGYFTHYIHSAADKNSLISNNTNNILEDHSGLIWISTRGGLSIFNPANHKFRNLVKENGLPDNVVLDIQEDDAQNIWVSTPNGLSEVLVDRSRPDLSFRFVNFNEADGLQGREFTENASGHTRKGELIFGGGNGFTLFRPSAISPDNALPTLLFTEFQLFNKPVFPGEKIASRVLLENSIALTHSLTLHHNENVFSLEFASLNCFNADKISYQYRMQGFDKSWTPFDPKARKVTYTNLDPGTYTFNVRSLPNAFGREQQISLQVVILPPFWKTPLAYLLYLLGFLSVLLLVRQRGIRQLRAGFALEKERAAAQQLHELDLMKIKFFTNVSHEFRTPLSLILAPVEKLLGNTDSPEVQSQLGLVRRNARRLLNLVNQLMDFRRMEYHELSLHKTPGDLISFIEETGLSFSDIGERKEIRFVFDSEVSSLFAAFDHDKTERILFNLLSNAYKFTPAGGQVTLLLALIEKEDAGVTFLEIRVIDTGIGIGAATLEKIFDPFFQNELPGSMLNQGSGIGLSITREFVRLQQGTINVESVPGEGSCFCVLLPVEKLSPLEMDLDAGSGLEFMPEFTGVTATQPGTVALRKAVVLLVEDNDDLRHYIRENLLDEFTVLEAGNGREGWQKALAQHPNLIVSDISMPEMNGIELCQKIKKDKRTAHIPVILLTAMIGEEEQLKGLETGATDYITKPFNFLILLSRIRNILSQQESMRRTYIKQVEANPLVQDLESPDARFINKVLSLIELNLGNPTFSVEELSGEMCMSRYTLYKKILALTGKTPVEFVRSMRMKKAAQLVEAGHFTISQISSKVGFKNQKYFVRSFKAEFNMIPSKYGTNRSMTDPG